MPNTIVITGCSTGFGRVTALHMAQQGWQVFATVRKEADQESLLAEAAQRGCAALLKPVICDITKPEAIKALGDLVAQATPGLQALVNNAGTAFPAPIEQITPDELRQQLDINVVGQIAVTQALLPLLKAAKGTIVNITSVGGRIAMPIVGAYNASKFALEALSDTLRIELAPFGVKVVVIQPGGSATAIWETSGQRSQHLVQESNPYIRLMTAMQNYFKSSAAKGFPPQQFAELVYKVVTHPDPATRYAIPGDVGRTILMRLLMPDKWWDSMLRGRLKW